MDSVILLEDLAEDVMYSQKTLFSRLFELTYKVILYIPFFIRGSFVYSSCFFFQANIIRVASLHKHSKVDARVAMHNHRIKDLENIGQRGTKVMEGQEKEIDELTKANEVLRTKADDITGKLAIEETAKATTLKVEAKAALDKLKQEFILQKNGLEKAKVEVEASLVTAKSNLEMAKKISQKKYRIGLDY